jgi:hypothetical protein
MGDYSLPAERAASVMVETLVIDGGASNPCHSPRSWVELAVKIVITSSPSATCYSMS